MAGVCSHPYLVLEVALIRLVGHVYASAGDIVLPAVVVTGKAVVLVTTEKQRRTTMGAVLGDQSHIAVGVPEGHQILTQQLNPLDVSILLRQVARW